MKIDKSIFYQFNEFLSKCVFKLLSWFGVYLLSWRAFHVDVDIRFAKLVFLMFSEFSKHVATVY